MTSRFSPVITDNFRLSYLQVTKTTFVTTKKEIFMQENGRSRKWFCRVTKTNNTQNGLYEYDFDDLYKTLCSKYTYVLFALHDKDQNNIHAHIIIQNKQAIRFNTLKNLLPYGDIQKQRGSNKECYEYCLHIDEKSKGKEKDIYDESCMRTNIQNIDEWKKLENEQGFRTDIADMLEYIRAGHSEDDFIKEYPSQYVRYGNRIREFYQKCLRERYSNTFRQLHITYIYGSTGVGKTRYVMEKHGYDKVYRVTNYGNGAFDNYNSQDVILFDEFRSSIKIAEMLTYLDGYPVDLHCRYANKPAVFTKVYIISNIPLYDQYKDVQKNEPQTYDAFCRRINVVYNFDVSKTDEIPLFIASQKPLDKLTAINIDKDELPF